MYMNWKHGRQPTPPPLPKYDPDEDLPAWTWSRMRCNLPVDKGDKPWTRIGEAPKSDDDPDWRGVIKSQIIEIPLPEPYKFGRYNDPRYFWFDTPDYADPFKKLWFACRESFRYGLVAGCVVGMFKGSPRDMKSILNLFHRVSVPWFIAGMAGAATIIVVANLRDKKDDYYNYVAGGLVMGVIFGRNHYIHWVRGTILSVAGLTTCKYYAETNGVLGLRFPHPMQRGIVSGGIADRGIKSGDLTFGIKSSWGDPGRDTRKSY